MRRSALFIARIYSSGCVYWLGKGSAVSRLMIRAKSVVWRVSCTLRPGIAKRDTWAGLHDNVPDRPSAIYRLHLLGANWRPRHLKIKTVTLPKRWIARQKLSPNLGRQCIWAELLQETGGLSVALEVNRLGRCRATQPWSVSAAKDMHDTRPVS